MLPFDKDIYFKILDVLEAGPTTRRQLIDAYVSSTGLSRAELSDKSTSGKLNIMRSRAGDAIDDMIRKGIIIRSEKNIYTAAKQTPVVIRNEECEHKILEELAIRPMTKKEINSSLVSFFGTDKTLTKKDDGKLFASTSEILSRLIKLGAVVHENNRYSLPPRIAAKIDDIKDMLALKQSFLSKLYKRGGEFFEIYFMTLLGKYLERHGKVVISNTVTGGSDDGGIDGIIETSDVLGFIETIMVQTKNRNATVTPTEIRGFYGAVCAKQGSRGIFATTSNFHNDAKDFLDSIDNCVGVDGDKIFSMATETLYGIKQTNNELAVDEDVI